MRDAEVVEVEIDVEAVQQMVYEEIMPICYGKPYEVALTGLLVSCALVLKPDLTEDKIYEIVGPLSDQLVSLLKLVEMPPATSGMVH